MKFAFLTVITFALVAIAGVVPARAQVIDTLDANIPFSFTVRNTTLPAGDYTIRRVYFSDPNVMEISDSDGRSKVLFIVGDAETAKTPGRPELIFDRVGSRYFLSEIFEVGSTTGVELEKSHAERQLEREGMMVQRHSVGVALNAAQ